MRYLITLLFSAFACLPAYADSAAPVIYSKTIIKIIPKPADAVAQKPEPAKKPDAKEQTPAERQPHEFTAEVRPLQFLYQRDFIAHTPLDDNTAMLVMLNPNDTQALAASSMVGTVDVLFIGRDGLITRIAPNLAINALEEPLASEKPTKAFLFLKSGIVKLDAIAPGDRIENTLFKQNPLILDQQSPPAAPVATPHANDSTIKLPDTSRSSIITNPDVKPAASPPLPSQTQGVITPVQNPVHEPLIIPALQPGSDPAQDNAPPATQGAR